jgi:hypothetical protein
MTQIHNTGNQLTGQRAAAVRGAGVVYLSVCTRCLVGADREHAAVGTAGECDGTDVPCSVTFQIADVVFHCLVKLLHLARKRSTQLQSRLSVTAAYFTLVMVTLAPISDVVLLHDPRENHVERRQADRTRTSFLQVDAAENCLDAKTINDI